ncbi:sodium:calcium antiporter, partial [candidate division KSB1 bacterium]|nr:sodium:calcium antiporter [Nitrospinaceae bacterium]NIR52954.1 sodium:calcium antiporter [candidate division KSB1 bacterium]NIT75106.1 sodium:calcium antiporter [candidate division KSB1 bacterium]NIX74786.1 sodium:calcium antiporter [candidate division KSB1 bacterium]
LGLTALLIPLTLSRERFRKEIPPLLIATFLILYLAWDRLLVRWEGLLLLAGLAWYIWRALKDDSETTQEFEDEV